ncbi:MAG: 6-phosphogluconolactonase [Nocardioidaceae bacterium]|jgi:6-phosphogluconolactonase|nr:6-phosphogluconolactonase [Nocardioidaceae bacterium]
MSVPAVAVHRDAQALAEAVAARLITRLVDVQSSGRLARIVLTGGTIADRIHHAVAASKSCDAVDWGGVEVWWGDERFVAADDPERNERQARLALLDKVRLEPGHVHPMPPPDQAQGDPDIAAEMYTAELAAAAGPGDHDAIPTFDVLMLGIGPEGHVASLFPGMPALYDERPVAGVRGCPKPPPVRVTMTMPTLQHAHDVWFVASGEEKARAVHLALSGAGPMQVPAAGPKGMLSTWWLLDKPAASELPAGLQRVATS